eukprot:CAMPEP_0115024630 /NCGR_PEP_ID=MMETSP0216-20121206/33397_1 /TAXON_ID=223996 /ORGANISM="Protocruzia adherens, Strain Boccale" /LENGTH=401 /DNA_ID=CAMNT_0002398815 /DNA_START=160 /DNA_END=1365 /DNA_ORIENTATION=-
MDPGPEDTSFSSSPLKRTDSDLFSVDSQDEETKIDQFFDSGKVAQIVYYCVCAVIIVLSGLAISRLWNAQRSIQMETHTEVGNTFEETNTLIIERLERLSRRGLIDIDDASTLISKLDSLPEHRRHRRTLEGGQDTNLWRQSETSDSAEVAVEESHRAMKNLMSVYREAGDQLNDRESIQILLDEIVDETRESVIQQLQNDEVGKLDFALASFGGKIIRSETSESYMEHRFSPSDGIMGHLKSLLVSSEGDNLTETNRRLMNHGPENLIHKSRDPGSCWAFQGSAGFVTIQLATNVVITQFTLEHSNTIDRSTAPREFKIYAVTDENARDAKEANYSELGSYEFKLEPSGKLSLHTFNCQTERCKNPVHRVRVEFESNNGSEQLTCVYRFRVHGNTPEETS